MRLLASLSLNVLSSIISLRVDLRQHHLRPRILALVPVMARAQLASGEQNAHSADTPSRGDAAALQKKATEAQVRIHANKDDRDQLMTAVKTNEVPLPKKSSSETDSPPQIWKTRRLLYGPAAGRESKTE